MASPDRTNSDRARRAFTAVEEYIGREQVSLDDVDDAHQVFGDLLGDLRHLADRLGVDFTAANDRGFTHYEAELGCTVAYEDLGESVGGYYRKSDSSIVVGTRVSVNGQVRTLVHELAHALGVGYAEYGRETAEVIVECAAVIACGSIGLDTSGESIPYIAGWGAADDAAAIRAYAAKVDECASRIERALEVK